MNFIKLFLIFLIFIQLTHVLFYFQSIICLVLFILSLLSHYFFFLNYLLFNCISICFLVVLFKIIVLFLEFIEKMPAFTGSNVLLNSRVFVSSIIYKGVLSSFLLILNGTVIIFSSLDLRLLEESIVITHSLVLIFHLLILVV